MRVSQFPPTMISNKHENQDKKRGNIAAASFFRFVVSEIIPGDRQYLRISLCSFLPGRILHHAC
jgi:hypothetical protein